MLLHEETELRARIVQEAKTWVQTPWHHQGRVKGIGVDCAQLLIGVYAWVGIIRDFEPEHYGIDWAFHRDEPRFLTQLLEHCIRVRAPLPGDIALYTYGRHASHGGICLGDGLLLHAWRDEGKVTITELAAPTLAERHAGFYSWKGF